MAGGEREAGSGRTRGLLGRIGARMPGRPLRASSDVPRVTLSRDEARRLNERFALLDRRERRAIVRAVNRGEPMERRRDAELAIGVARRQQRFWSRAWLLGPVIAALQVLVTPLSWVEGLLLAGWGALLLGMMAAWWWTRARRAELENLRVVGSRGLRGPASDTRGPRSRLPGGAPRADATGADDETEDGEHGPAAPRPPRPRGRKRR